MLYQSVLLGRIPYVVRRARVSPFHLHFHHEIELLYAREGSFVVAVDGIPYTIRKGELLFVESMKPHEILASENARALLVELGPVFLGEGFSRLTSLSFAEPVFALREDEKFTALRSVSEELWELAESPSPESEFMLLGDLYRLCALLISLGSPSENVATRRRNDAEIEKVLALIHSDYSRNITVEEAANLAGYGKSNFCKLFKCFMGVSFHSYLNSFRIENARYLLCTSNGSIASVGEAVGLPDPKTFCRVFRKCLGVSPQEYRKTK